MANFNRVILLGQLAEDPGPIDERGSGSLDFRIEVTDRYRGVDGDPVEDVNVFNVTAFGGQADYIKNLSKGSKILVEGRLVAPTCRVILRRFTVVPEKED